jgi:hypothetical protein
MKRAFLFGLGTSGELLTIYALFLSALYTLVAGQAQRGGKAQDVPCDAPSIFILMSRGPDGRRAERLLI